MSKIFMLTHKQLNSDGDHVRHQERLAMEGCTKLGLLEP